MYKGDDFPATGRLRFKPFTKASEQKVPLCPSSGHAAHVHRAWPRAEISRLRARADCEKDFNEAKANALNRFKTHGIHDDVLKKSAMVSFDQNPRGKVESGQCFWWALPYHPVLFKSRLVKVLRELEDKWQSHVTGFQGIRIAWYNDAKAHIHNVRRC